MDRQLRNRLTCEVVHKVAGEPDRFGDVSFVENIDRMCYKYGKIEMVRAVDGNEVVSSLQLIFHTEIPIQATDEFEVDGLVYKVKAWNHWTTVPVGTQSGLTRVYL